jgi:hypothetical protein
MNTTALFVELIVIGVGTAAWITLLILSVFGYSWIPGQQITALIALLPFLSLIYVLGIVTDYLVFNIYRKVFRRLEDFFCRRYLGEDIDVEAVRTYVYTYAAENVINRFEYDRSRLRICRAWSVNFVCLAISTIIFLWTDLAQVDFNIKIKISIFSTIVCAFGVVATFYTWRNLSEGDYKRLKRTSTFLKVERGEKPDEIKLDNNPAAPERSQGIGEMQRLSASGERERL